MENKTKIAIGIAGAGLLVLGGLGGALMFSTETKVPVIKYMNNTIVEEKIVEVPVEIIKEVNNTIEVEKIVEDESFKQMACFKLQYEDMDDCVNEIKAEDEALNMALDLINDETDFFDMLEDKSIVNDEDDVEIIRVYDKSEDINITKSNFDDNEYEFKIRVKIEDTDAEVKKYVIATIKVEDNEVELTKVKEE